MKTPKLVILALLLLTGPLSAQDNKASVLLSSAIYEEEVSGNLDKAVELYLSILKKYPEDRPVAAKSLYHLGLVNEKMGKQKANEYYTRLVNSYPEQKELVALAKSKLTRLDRLSTGITKEAEQHFTKAGDLMNQWQYDQAIKEYGSVIRLIPKTVMALEAKYWIGQALFRSGKNDDALVTFQQLLRENPQSLIAPVTQLMINQVQLAKSSGKKVPANRISDEGKILDPGTGIEYTLVKAFGGKNDEALRWGIYGLSPEYKFLLASNYVVSLDSLEPLKLFDIPSSWKVQPSRLSPDGTRVAYFDIDTLKLLAISPKTGHPTGVPKTLRDGHQKPLTGRYVDWSPDGQKLGFIRSDSINPGDVWTLSLSDGTMTQITNTPETEWYPVFSRDGGSILYPQGDYPRYSLRKSPAGGGQSETIVESGAYNVDFYWSGDQQNVLQNGGTGYLEKIRLHNQQKFLIKLPAEVGKFIPGIHQDDQLFFFRSSNDRYYSIKVISPSGGPALELRGSSNQSYGNLNWTPDNRMIITTFKRNSDASQIVQMIPLTGEDPVELEGIDGRYYKVFAPDCSRFIDLSYNPDNLSYDLRMFNVSLTEGKIAGPPVVLSHNIPSVPRSYSWSPDGSKIALEIKGDIWIYPIDGGVPVKLTHTSETEYPGNWSPDGTMLTIGFKLEGNPAEKVVKVSDGQEIKRWVGSYCDVWSPDGKEIAAVFENGQISAVSVGTGTIRKILDWKAMGLYDIYNLAWSPDGLALAFIGNISASKDIYPIYLVNSSGGIANELKTDDTGFKSFVEWSPDGKWIAYCAWSGKKTRLESSLWQAKLNDFVAIKDTGAIPVTLAPADGTFVDSRDGHQYSYKKIGNQTWMTENLAYLPEAGSASTGSDTLRHYYVYGYAGNDTAAARLTENYRTFGVLYNWRAAMNREASSSKVPSEVRGICPADWHLPSDGEWMVLEKQLGLTPEETIKTGWRTTGSVGLKLQAPYGTFYNTESWKDGNSSGFNSLPGGYRSNVGGLFFILKGGYYHTSTEADSTSSFHRIMAYSNLGVFRIKGEKGYGYSVRCIKND